MRLSALPLLLLLALGAGACSKNSDPMSAATGSADASRGLVGQANAEGSFLAYSHDATVRIPGPDIAARVSAVRSACMEARHGSCTVLAEEQSSGQWPEGKLRLRADPKAIEPLVAMAAEGGELFQRSTEAEDLADAVRDNGLRQQRLRTQHQRLSEFLARRDIKAEDLIALSNQLAQIETELQASEQEAAQQQRRIRTNLLTLRFTSSQVTVASSEVGEALRDSLSTLDTSVAVLLTLVVALLPFALLLLVVAWVVRMMLRRRRRSAD
ncbi:MAG TPA: DUF4349 domain-containing protein [Arenimonas sp.]|uniref:DUF4349 domain-containing protein n=1 Tax=Arenimonas sp. TaxID=1872635 RepID=UPI002D8078EF|nr:DUF4349 domain-containing protein [Arenimonas sp.]HEU0153411.1 DUF4349 domain-containing protein [Arenimonas sp.]